MSYVRAGALDWWPVLDMRSCVELIKINRTLAGEILNRTVQVLDARGGCLHKVKVSVRVCVEENHKL